jgi:fructosamine-3-kinase
MDATLRSAIEGRLGSRVTRAQRLSGGDVNQAFEVGLADGQTLFVKTHARPLPQMFLQEAEGLAWLAEARALRVARVLAVSDGHEQPAAAAANASRSSVPAFLALEWIAPGSAAADHDEQLGRGLAQLHRHGASRFGLMKDNYIASLRQANTATQDWPIFYAERRLRPQLALAVERGLASSGMRRGLERVLSRIEELCGPAEPPARLHGDLWRGNCLVDSRGGPVLIDPAVYAGHREVDLAMMHLFGGFGARCFSAYDELHPRADGHAQRLGLYQLYPLLVHVNVFGGCYVASVERVLHQLV